MYSLEPLTPSTKFYTHKNNPLLGNKTVKGVCKGASYKFVHIKKTRDISKQA